MVAVERVEEDRRQVEGEAQKFVRGINLRFRSPTGETFLALKP